MGFRKGFGFTIPRIRSGAAAFNPLTDVNGLKSYWDYNNVTVSLATDLGVASHDLQQGTASKQPTIDVPNFRKIFDGIDDVQVKAVANPYSGDSSGIMFFSGYATGSAQWHITACDAASQNHVLAFGVNTAGEILIQSKVAGAVSTIKSTNTITTGQYFYGYVKSTGIAYEINLNGTIEVLQVTGSNDGNWFGDFAVLDNLAHGARVQSTPVYGDAENNKIAYTNDYTIDTTDMLTYMSVPSNHL